MKQNILDRLQELSVEIEARLNERETYVKHLKKLDTRIKEISVIIPELQSLLDNIESK